MTFLQRKLRTELNHAESWVRVYRQRFNANGQNNFDLLLIHHFEGRRRYLLRSLLKIQLKEFDRDG